jgi:hypothetical protein
MTKEKMFQKQNSIVSVFVDSYIIVKNRTQLRKESGEKIVEATAQTPNNRESCIYNTFIFIFYLDIFYHIHTSTVHTDVFL